MSQIQTSLYVGDLDLNVTDLQLYDMFNQVGRVVSVRVCRDRSTRRSLGYGYVNYSNPHDAARAMEVLNFIPLNSKAIRLMYSHSNRKTSTAANVFIKDLDKTIDNKALHDTFSIFGCILSCKIATDSSGESKGYGFVQFDSEEAAQIAIDKLNGMLINDKQVYVGRFLPKQERSVSALGNNTKFNNIYVKNIDESTADDDLKTIFGEYGTITSAVVMRDADGKSKCFGFVNFEDAGAAARAVEALNGKRFDGKEWYVGKAQKKSEREQTKFPAGVNNLYIKNLDDSIDDEKLREVFSGFGAITSCKVMSRGYGFVAFSTPGEASRALNELNGKMLMSKPLYVAVAQRKEERRAKLQAKFMQMRPAASLPGFGQAPAIIPPQAGFAIGYPRSVPMPNFFGRGGGPAQQNQQPVIRGRMMYRYPPRDAAMPITGLASAVANATPEQRRMMLGQKLYPLVDQLEHERAAKVTGMLLEMDQPEVLHLLESPDALKAKVAEAMDVLRNANEQQPVHH